MKKLLSYFVIAFLIFGLAALYWAAFSLGNSSYAFWKHGVETTAVVLSLEHVSRSAKGGNISFRPKTAWPLRNCLGCAAAAN